MHVNVESGVEGIIGTICDCWNYNYGIFRRDKTIERIRALAAELKDAEDAIEFERARADGYKTENERLREQIDRLADVILKEFDGPTHNEGACDTAIRKLRALAAERDEAIENARCIGNSYGAALKHQQIAAKATGEELDARLSLALHRADKVAAENERLREAIGLMTTAKPDMEVDASDPVGMAQQVVAENERLSKALAEAIELINKWTKLGLEAALKEGE